jgi:SAM-dependent methyltransferase
MNPYQRITRGAIRQQGHIDTQAKFKQLTADVDLTGKRVLDVGCNLGEMCRLAKEAGAAEVRGVDCEPEYIYDARKIAPGDGIVYECRSAYNIAGDWDIIIASACLHYMDIDKALAQFARCGQMVLADVTFIPPNHRELRDVLAAWPIFAIDSGRPLYLPNPGAFIEITHRHFNHWENHGPALSPDDSERRIIRMYEPKPSPARAVIFYGKGSTGKTSRGRDLRYAKGYDHLELDSVFLAWKMEMEPQLPMSVLDFVYSIWNSSNPLRRERYLAFYRDYLYRWLGCRQHNDVVIEGFDPIFDPFRAMVRSVLEEHGWQDIVEQECK